MCARKSDFFVINELKVTTTFHEVEKIFTSTHKNCKTVILSYIYKVRCDKHALRVFFL